MPNVTLIDFTGCGAPQSSIYAAQLLAFTKATRLNMTPDLWMKFGEMTVEQLTDEIEYMATTIRSSWEFVNMTFLVEGITRATAQQMTRSRHAKFAMQSLRVADASGIPITNPCPKDSPGFEEFEEAVHSVRGAYVELLDMDVPKEDARGILPLNTQSTLVVQYDLRNFVDLYTARCLSLRVQGEYREVAAAMYEAVQEIWPWSAPFFESPNAAAIRLLEQAAEEAGITPGEGSGWKIAKAIDLLRRGA